MITTRTLHYASILQNDLSMEIPKYVFLDTDTGTAYDCLHQFASNTMKQNKPFSVVYLVMLEFRDYDKDENPSFFVTADHKQVLSFLEKNVNESFERDQEDEPLVVFIFEYPDYTEALATAADIAETSSKHTPNQLIDE